MKVPAVGHPFHVGQRRLVCLSLVDGVKLGVQDDRIGGVSGSIPDRDQLFGAKNTNGREREAANFLVKIFVEVLGEYVGEYLGEFHLSRGGFVEEVGLAGESSPIDRAGNWPYVTDPNVPARFAHDPLQSAGDRAECFLVHTQPRSRALDFNV
jgi:hypothetical protein